MFVTLYNSLAPEASFADWGASFLHGFSIDCSVAGYLTVIPALIAIASLLTAKQWPRTAEKVYYIIISVILSFIFCLDICLYSYWDFRLDATPVFYFATSPASAMASAEWWQVATGALAVAAIAGICFCLLHFTAGKIKIKAEKSVMSIIPAVVLLALLFIPIRGGFTVAPMNLSRAYFSDITRVNHAAINPVFSLLYSLSHQNDFASRYRFMDEKEAQIIVDSLFHAESIASDSAYAPISHTQKGGALLKTGNRPDVYIIILESFSSHLFKSLGGEDVASGLDSVARQGILFSNFYASGFRTDRGIPAILSGFPAQPTTSIMKYVEKTASLPGIAKELKKIGYETAYYYGGDARFTNMQAYLRNTGFSKLVADSDFPLSERLSKWGVHDHVLFNKLIADIRSQKTERRPHLRVLQTSSSHEPFEVPYSNPRFADNKIKNAFAYTDSCVTRFLCTMHSEGLDRNAIVLLVPDHYGAWPKGLEDAASRHHIPLILTGGALLRNNETISTFGSQTDIPAILLGALGIDHSAFEWSRNILNHNGPEFAFYTEPNELGVITPDEEAVFDSESCRPTTLKGDNARPLIQSAEAILQILFSRIDKL